MPHWNGSVVIAKSVNARPIVPRRKPRSSPTCRPGAEALMCTGPTAAVHKYGGPSIRKRWTRVIAVMIGSIKSRKG